MKKILLSILALNSLSVAFADIAKGNYKGETTRRKACSLTIISVTGPKKLPADRYDTDRLEYRVKFKTSFTKEKELDGALYLECKDYTCKEFSTDLRQTIGAYTSDNADHKIEITVSSDVKNQGSSTTQYGKQMPKYTPTSVSTDSEVCTLK